MNNKFIFWKPIKVKSFLNLGIYPKRNKKEIRLIDTNPFGDADKDKVPNILDCKPLDKRKQSYMFRKEIRKRLNLPMSRKEHIKKIIEGLTKPDKSYKKNPKKKFVTQEEVVRFFEKNPDLLQKAEKVRGRKINYLSILEDNPPEGEFIEPVEIERKDKSGWVTPPGVRYQGERGRLPSTRPSIALNPYTSRKMNTGKVIRHELKHRDQFADKEIWDKLHKEDQKFLQAHTTEEVLEQYGPSWRPITRIKRTTKYKHGELPVEKDVKKRMRDLPERKKVHKESPELLKELYKGRKR